MPTVWGFVAILQIGVVISDVCEIRRRYYGNAPIYPVFERGYGSENAILEKNI